ncbi:hypothetical protein POM88_006188 [Heracleum sosnowskyi]|uniref:Transposase MuDR plant domain-containing protein n=1 Tax=Heracleum sosnowskyi TaxID=360622 RepID=A0AAD8J5X3_9APIA|nr:hypothetical protein POM88_006188 [Heracleum sosnowskyi]
MPGHDMSASTSNGSLRVFLYYAGAFVVSPHTGIKNYEDKKKLVKNNVQIKKLSVQEIRDIFSDVIGPLHWLYYFRNGVTPDNGYKLLERDDQVPELVYLAKRLGGGSVIRLHLYTEKLEDWGDPESEDEVNAWKETERRVLGHNVEFGQDWGNNESEMSENEEDRAESGGESGGDEDYDLGMVVIHDDDPGHDIGDGSDSDLSDCRRIREEVRREQEELDIEMSQEIREALQKFKDRESDDDDTDDGLYSSEDDDTDDGIAYAEPKAKKKKVRVNEVFKMCTAAKDIKWVPGLIFGDKNQVKAAVRSYSIDTGRPLRYNVNDLQRIQIVCAKGCPFKMWLSYLKEKDFWIRRNPSWKLKEMQEEIKKELKLEVGEAKCCRVRKRALSQVQEEMVKHYAGVRRFGGEILRSNPKNTVKITTTRLNEEDTPHFQRQRGHKKGKCPNKPDDYDENTTRKRAPKRKQMTEQEVEIREEIERAETEKETGEAQLMEEAEMEMNATPTTPRRSQRIEMPKPNVQQSHAQNGTPPASRPPSHGTCRRGRPKIPVKRGRPVNAFKAPRNQSN